MKKILFVLAFTFFLSGMANAQVERITAGGGGGGIEELSEDTTPQLGGNLDVNGFTITNLASTGQILFNSGGSLTGESGLTFNNSTDFLSVNGGIDLTSTGVRASATDGVLTLLGLGNGNDENLVIDFDNQSSNVIRISSGTGVTGITFNSINLTAGVFSGALIGNATTATALASNGSNCSAGQFPLGVSASGAAESCTALPTTISGTSNEITASASTGAVTLSLPSTINLSSKTLRIPNSTSLPGTCTVGDTYMDTDATAGQRWYLCESTNTWSAQGRARFSVTDTDTSFSGTFNDAAKIGYYSLTTSPGSSSSAITAAVLGENIYGSSSSTTGTGHSVGVFGRTDFTGTGDPLWQIPVEGRCDTTGNGVEDAVNITQCTAFTATFGADTGSTGNIGIGVGFYLGNMSDDANVSTKLSFFSDDADWSFRNDGPGQFGGALTLASSQQAAGQGSHAAARYAGPMGSNDIAALGAGGVAMSAGQMYCTKIMMPRAGTMDSIQVEVITDGGGDLRLGVYADSNGLPGALIEDGGALTVSSTGVKTDTLSTAVQAGVVWGCVAVQGSGLTIDFNIVTNYHEIYGVDASRTAGQAAALETGVTGALPSTFGGAIAATSALTPGVGISLQ